MTSAQLMQTRRGRSDRRRAALAMMVVAIATLCGCDSLLKGPAAPELSTPYAGGQVWAVAPLANESGVSDIDTARVADLLAQEVQQVRGVDVIPVNRVILAMRQMDMPAVASPADAMSLMNVLNVDGVIVGTITAWDPYKPPVLGAAVELHLRERLSSSSINAQQLTKAVSGEPAPGELGPVNPVAQAAGVFDARHKPVQEQLERFSRTRVEKDAAFGQDIYLVRMELYTQFVSYQLIASLMESERRRLGLVVQALSER